MKSRPARRSDARDLPRSPLLDEILFAADRDHPPGARPVISFAQSDETDYLAAIEARALDTLTLARRGVYHGEWAELDPALLGLGPWSSEATGGALAMRWHAARPIVLRGAARHNFASFAPEIALAAELHEELKEPGGLRRFLAQREADLSPQFHPLGKRATLFDPERDIERVLLESIAPGQRSLRGGRGRRVQDLWVKSAWLSTHEGEDSLRLRVSFGRERDDDASHDLLRHRLVAELATILLPGSRLVSADPDLTRLIEGFTREPVLFTQHIAYWNSPEGGALFHHDAFVEDGGEVAQEGQLGVCYLQLSGRTAWLALSTQDLAARVREFGESLAEGSLAWVRAQLFPDAVRWQRFERLLSDKVALARELALPGCGFLGPLVNRGPEFTSFLADAGHALLLSAGDAILLPNHDPLRTAMHSVFSGGEATAYSLSLAIRADRELDLSAG